MKSLPHDWPEPEGHADVLPEAEPADLVTRELPETSLR